MRLLTPHIINTQHQKLLSNSKNYTNYFSYQDQIVYGEITEKSLVFILKNKGFNSLYFTSIDLDDLEKLIAKLSAEDICLEMIQKGDMPLELENILKKYFILESIYEKMTLYIKNLKPKLKIKNLKKDIQHCDISELDFLYQNLYESFDVRFDHLPNKNTLSDYISKNQVLIKTKNDQISAYCIFTLKGKTSHFNYLKNLKASSFEIIELLEEYYEKMKMLQIEHIYLWVDILKNIRVKNMHSRYGYQPSNVFNYTFVKINSRRLS